MKLKIRPLTPNLWPALEDLFGENGACNGCWCMYWRIGSVSQEAARDQQGGVSRSREEGATSGLGRFRWRFGRWVVPAYAPR